MHGGNRGTDPTPEHRAPFDDGNWRGVLLKGATSRFSIQGVTAQE